MGCEYRKLPHIAGLSEENGHECQQAGDGQVDRKQGRISGKITGTTGRTENDHSGKSIR